jgi:hypothetical protein
VEEEQEYQKKQFFSRIGFTSRWILELTIKRDFNIIIPTSLCQCIPWITSCLRIPKLGKDEGGKGK